MLLGGSSSAAAIHDKGKELVISLACALALIVFIHIVPKSAERGDLVRLSLTILYFLALLAFCYDLWKSAIPWLNVYLRYIYKNVPATIGKSLDRFLYSFTRVSNQLLIVLGAFILCSFACKVLLWFPPLYHFLPAATVLWWASFIVLIVTPWRLSTSIIEAYQRYKLFREEIVIGNIIPLDLLADRKRELRTIASPTNINTTEHEFEAGGKSWSHFDLCKSMIIFGQPGSGKTVCVLNSLLQGWLSATNRNRSSLLILDPKGDYLHKIQRLSQSVSRSEDLIVFDPVNNHQELKWNPFDNPDDAFELAERYGAVMDVLGVKDSQSSFWSDKAKQFAQHSIILLRAQKDSVPSLGDIAELSTSKERILALCENVDEADGLSMQSVKFFAEEWFELPQETLGGIQGHLTAMLNPFTVEPYRSFTSGSSSFKISDVVENGKLLYLHMPIADKEAMARVLGTFVKLEFYREVLRRPDKVSPSLFFCDEFQVFFNANKGKGDADFFERSRQSNHANIIACQNIQSLYKQVDKKEAVLNLLGTCAIKMFLRNTDKETNQYASDLFGQSLFGASSGGGGVNALRKKNRQTSSVSYTDQLSHNVSPDRFVKLAIPSKKSGISYAEALIHDASSENPNDNPVTYRWGVNPL